MIDLLDKFVSSSSNILAYFLGTGFVIICAAAGTVVLKSSSLSYSNGQVSLNINADIKKASNDAEYANKVLLEKINALEQVVLDLEDDFVPVTIKESINDLKPVAAEAEKSNEELRTVVNKAIAQE